MPTRTTESGISFVELMLVIAIIGILASVTIVGVQSARERSRNTAATGELNALALEAEVYYRSQSPRSYDGLCDDPDITPLVTAANAHAQSADCNVSPDGTAYAAAAVLNGTAGHYCVDSKRFAGTRTTALGSATVCPSS